MGHRAGGRHFYGFAAPDAPQETFVHPRQAISVSLKSGDLLRLNTDVVAGSFGLLAFDNKGARCEAYLGWDEAEKISLRSLQESDFESGALRGWLSSQGAYRSTREDKALYDQSLCRHRLCQAQCDIIF